jgi:hypothetical protein
LGLDTVQKDLAQHGNDALPLLSLPGWKVQEEKEEEAWKGKGKEEEWRQKGSVFIFMFWGLQKSTLPVHRA